MEDKILKVAREAAEKAGKRALSLFGKPSVVREKGSPTDIVSEADLVAEDIIYFTLTRAFPNFNYLSEERELIDKGSEYTWIIDPIDGSIPFVAGLDNWSISIGLLKEKEPVMGVVAVPTKQWLVWARRRNGAFINNQKIIVSKQQEYAKAVVGYDVGHRGYRREDLLRDVASQIENVRYMPSYASTIFAQILVAKGSLDAYMHHRCFIWDVCAGAVIVQEAGGKVTDHQGKPLDWSKRDGFFMLASNDILHDKILGAIKL